MKNIKKGKEPRLLVQHRQSGGDFDGAGPWKDEVKRALLKEQGELCCYCMGRIEPQAMKLEHFRSQSEHPARQLEYANLLAACPGGQVHASHAGVDLRHCDSRKGNEAISLDPVAGVEHRLSYRFTEGRIAGEDAEAERELNEVLNLNAQHLRQARQRVIEGLAEGLEKKHRTGTWSAPVLRRELERWSQRDGDRFRPYCRVAVAYLEKKLRRASP